MWIFAISREKAELEVWTKIAQTTLYYIYMGL